MAKTGTWSTGRCVGGSEAGATLLELLVVLAGLGTALAVALPNLPRNPATLVIAAETVAETLRAHRVAAVTENRVRVIRSNPGTGGLDLPPGVALVLAESSAAITFYPDGTVSGGVLVLERAGERRSLTIDWLTGRISVARH